LANIVDITDIMDIVDIADIIDIIIGTYRLSTPPPPNYIIAKYLRKNPLFFL